MAKQLIADLYGCDMRILDSVEEIKKIARSAVESIGAEIVEESAHKFDPVGISYYAIISTSHFSVHTWPELGYAAVDVFSCSELVTGQILALLQSALRAERCIPQTIERRITR